MLSTDLNISKDLKVDLKKGYRGIVHGHVPKDLKYRYITVHEHASTSVPLTHHPE